MSFMLTISVMHPPARICRAIVQEIIGRPVLSARQQQREREILVAGEKLMARFGRHGVTPALIAASVSLSRATLFFHFTDLDALLGEILRRHLRQLEAALAAVPHNIATRQADLRAAYRAATTAPTGGPSDAHVLLARDRALLPVDQRQGLDQTWQSLTEKFPGILPPAEPPAQPPARTPARPHTEIPPPIDRRQPATGHAQPKLIARSEFKTASRARRSAYAYNPALHGDGPILPAHIAAAFKAGSLDWLHNPVSSARATGRQTAPPAAVSSG